MAASLSSLLRQVQIADHEEILSAANTTLKSSSVDNAAHHAKVVALLHLDRFEDAVRAFDTAGDVVKRRARLEYAYALYKAGEWDKAEEIAEGLTQGSRGGLHISAQIKYRLEQFQEAARMYEVLGEGDCGDLEDERDLLRANQRAVDAQQEWTGLTQLVNKKRIQREDLQAFESAFNAACISIARGDFAQGEVLLRRAKDLCVASEDLSEDEKQADLTLITAQQAYILLCGGKLAEAKMLMDSIDLESVQDPAIQLVVHINKLITQGIIENSFMLQRAFSTQPPIPKKDKLFRFQLSTLEEDKHIIDLLSSKYSGVARSTSRRTPPKAAESTTSRVNVLSALNAAAHAKGEVGKQALKMLLPLLEQRPTDVGLLLTVIQLHVAAKDRSLALKHLKHSLTEMSSDSTSEDTHTRFAPGLVGIIIALYSQHGQASSIRTELIKAAQYWQSRQAAANDGTATYATLLRAAGYTLLANHDAEDAKTAADIFHGLQIRDPTDKASAAGLVSALALQNPTEITQSLSEKVSDPSRLVLGIDAEALETAGVAQPSQSLNKTPLGKRGADVHKLSRKRRKLKGSKMPKDYDHNKKMDAERWLPLRDRSYWKPKGRRGKARQAGLTQGGAVDDKPAVQAETLKAAGGLKSESKKKKKGKGGR